MTSVELKKIFFLVGGGGGGRGGMADPVLEAKDYSYLQEMPFSKLSQQAKLHHTKRVDSVQVSQANQVTLDTSWHLSKDPPDKM